MNSLQAVGSCLPTTPKELVPFIAVGNAAVNAARNVLKSGKLSKEQFESVLQKAQEQGILVIDAKVELGKAIRAAPDESGKRTDLLPSKQEVGKTAIFKDLNLTQRQASNYQLIAQNPEAVEKAKTIAKENNDIPTESLILQVIKQEKKETQLFDAKQSILNQTKNEVKTPPTVHLMDCVDFIHKCKPYDLLLTDPPYSTDILNIAEFVDRWLYPALERVKPTGSAYIFIGAYPAELAAYLNAEIPDNVHLEQVLIWTYKNTGGKIPNEHYKQNYQACLYYRGKEAGQLDNKDNEFWAVTEINAPDGRIGDRYHAWQKPMELAEMYIRHSTKQGDRVVDPFCCTGTFPLAAAKLGRIGIGADNDEDNLKIAVNRGCILH